MDTRVLEEYAVDLTPEIDLTTTSELTGLVEKAAGWVKNLGPAGSAAASVILFFGGVSAVTVGLIRGVVDADMEFKRLGQSMWITKGSAKRLSIALKAMHASADDVAWVPELRRQFFRLSREVSRYGTPEDADKQIRWIRSLEFDVQSLMVKIQMLKEWTTYYLIKYLRPVIREFHAFIRDLNGRISQNLPEIARKIAKALSSVASVIITTHMAFEAVFDGVEKWIDTLPANVKKWALIFAIIGVFFLSSPLGIIVAVFSGFALLLQDYIYHKNGWNSSRTLAPLWVAVDRFFHNKPYIPLLNGIKRFLSNTADTMDGLVKEFLGGFDINAVKNEWSKAIYEFSDGFNDMAKGFEYLLGKMDDYTSAGQEGQNKSFFTAIGKAVTNSIKSMATVTGDVGTLFKAIGLAIDGDWSGAWKLICSLKTYSPVEMVGKGVDSLFSALDQGSSRIGRNIASFAKSHYIEGSQWMAWNNPNADKECASWVSDVYRNMGIRGLDSMSTVALVSAFGSAYHRAGDGYTPAPGDMIYWQGHVGLYLGGGMYRARNSRGGVHTGSMQEASRYFGPVLGYGSIAQYYQYKMGKDPGYDNPIKGAYEGVKHVAYTVNQKVKTEPKAEHKPYMTPAEARYNLPKYGAYTLGNSTVVNNQMQTAEGFIDTRMQRGGIL